jgi:hypothetical protein
MRRGAQAHLMRRQLNAAVVKVRRFVVQSDANSHVVTQVKVI